MKLLLIFNINHIINLHNIFIFPLLVVKRIIMTIPFTIVMIILFFFFTKNRVKNRNCSSTHGLVAPPVWDARPHTQPCPLVSTCTCALHTGWDPAHGPDTRSCGHCTFTLSRKQSRTRLGGSHTVVWPLKLKNCNFALLLIIYYNSILNKDFYGI